MAVASKRTNAIFTIPIIPCSFPAPAQFDDSTRFFRFQEVLDSVGNLPKAVFKIVERIADDQPASTALLFSACVESLGSSGSCVLHVVG